MSPEREINYEALIDQTIRDFRPVQRLWPVGARLLCWILFEALILISVIWVRGYSDFRELFDDSDRLIATGLFIFASIDAAFLALNTAIPGRKVRWLQITVLVVGVAAAIGFVPAGKPSELFESAPALIRQLSALAVLPWLCLFWAVRRGVPLRPLATGMVVGLGAFCLASALQLMMTSPAGTTESRALLALCCLLAMVFSALAGKLWLNWIGRWQQESVATETWESNSAAFVAKLAFPLAISAATGLLMLVLAGRAPQVPDFDLAIESYHRAVEGFQPNVPSSSIETMLTAYVEHGMPAYMWDFGSEGFRLVGGRWEPLADGTPVSYTWFRRGKGGVICIFKQTEAFNPPSITHHEFHHLLFYRYRDFSFCLINVGGYGNFVSVIAAPMPLKQFEHLVVTATL